MKRDRLTAERAVRKKIASALESRRRALGVEPAELSASSGVDLSQLGKALRGQAGLSLYSLQRICDALGLDVAIVRVPRRRVAHPIQRPS